MAGRTEKAVASTPPATDPTVQPRPQDSIRPAVLTRPSRCSGVTCMPVGDRGDEHELVGHAPHHHADAASTQCGARAVASPATADTGMAPRVSRAAGSRRSSSGVSAARDPADPPDREDQAEPPPGRADAQHPVRPRDQQRDEAGAGRRLEGADERVGANPGVAPEEASPPRGCRSNTTDGRSGARRTRAVDRARRTTRISSAEPGS